MDARFTVEYDPIWERAFVIDRTNGLVHILGSTILAGEIAMHLNAGMLHEDLLTWEAHP